MIARLGKHGHNNFTGRTNYSFWIVLPFKVTDFEITEIHLPIQNQTDNSFYYHEIEIAIQDGATKIVILESNQSTFGTISKLIQKKSFENLFPIATPLLSIPTVLFRSLISNKVDPTFF